MWQTTEVSPKINNLASNGHVPHAEDVDNSSKLENSDGEHGSSDGGDDSGKRQASSNYVLHFAPG